MLTLLAIPLRVLASVQIGRSDVKGRETERSPIRSTQLATPHWGGAVRHSLTSSHANRADSEVARSPHNAQC